MSDLVERLRRAPASWPVCHEAATEIEHLRAALQEIRSKAVSGRLVEKDVVSTIDAALSGKGES